MHRNQFPAAFLVVMLAVAGCSGGLEAEVSGRVTLDGRPVGPGVATFAPANGAENPAIGKIDLDGRYTLATSRTTGLAAGTYHVAVSVFDQPDVAPGERSMVPAKLVTPEKYSSVETSGLEFEVKPGRNTIDIELVTE